MSKGLKNVQKELLWGISMQLFKYVYRCYYCFLPLENTEEKASNPMNVIFFLEFTNEPLQKHMK